MGIYSDGKVYGLSFTLDDETVHEIKSNGEEPLTPKQIKDAKDFYNTVKDKQKDITIRYYTLCSSTYGPHDTFYSWFPGDAGFIQKLFSSLGNK